MKIYGFWSKWADGFELRGTVIARDYEEAFTLIRTRVCLWNQPDFTILAIEIRRL